MFQLKLQEFKVIRKLGENIFFVAHRQKIRQSSDCLIFIQSEGLVCNRHKAYVITL